MVRYESSSRRFKDYSDSVISDYDVSESFEESGHRRKRKRNILEKESNEYLVKKALKKAVSVAKKLKTTKTVLGHSKDSDFNEKFVWKKKIERDVMVRGVKRTMDNLTVKAEKKRQKELMAEVEKVKKRREERVQEKARRNEELVMLQRERDRAKSGNLEMKDRQFDFEQCKIRSRIRLREGRPKAIDILTVYLDESDEFDIKKKLDEPPYMVFKGLTSVQEFEELMDDIKLYLDIGKASMSSTQEEYWEALILVCEWELRVRLCGDDRGMHSSIKQDVINYLEGKNYEELATLSTQIESLMLSGRAWEVEYWEAVRKHVHFYKAKACLNEIHSSRSLHHLQVQRALQGEIVKSKEGIEEDDDFEANAKKEVIRTMEEGGVVLGSGTEVNLDSLVYGWHDKYQPRKPKYLNHVYTSYEWNKYNRTHYDHDDNPPPKFVRGYKFNIFYPHLIDTSKVPKPIIEKDGDCTETCIIRFQAGPPYEDIAFRIVLEEWELSRKKGFKCTFEQGILRLYFNFKRFGYRR